MWCLAVMTIEAVTNHYLAEKSNKITSSPGQFAMLHKILQVSEFHYITFIFEIYK